jgi:ribosomal protein S27AE
MREEIELICPKCGSHRVMARTRDDYGRNVLYLACDTCDRTLTHEEVWKQVAEQIVRHTADRHSDLDFPEGGG